MRARRFGSWRWFDTVVCLSGMLACTAPEQTTSPGREEENEEAEREWAGNSMPRSGLECDDEGPFRRGLLAPLGSVAGDDVRITENPRTINENSVAVHPLDGNVLLCANNAQTPRDGGILASWSLDGGVTRSSFFIDRAISDPAAAIDRNGTFTWAASSRSSSSRAPGRRS
jgi:hypothetical protein